MITKYNKGCLKEKPPKFDENGFAGARGAIVKDC